MSKKLMSVIVTGENKKWCFEFYGDSQYLQEWRDDGLDVCEIENTIPVSVSNLGLVRMWCFFQDVINFKNPFSR